MDTVGNLVPMNWEVNQDVNREGSYRELEKNLRDAAEDPNNKVELKVEPIYTDDSRRPLIFKYIYIVRDKVTENKKEMYEGYIDNSSTTPRPKKRSNKNGKRNLSKRSGRIG